MHENLQLHDSAQTLNIKERQLGQARGRVQFTFGILGYRVSKAKSKKANGTGA
jgi:hypothetical protein